MDAARQALSTDSHSARAHLILAIASARLSDAETARAHLLLAESNWPAELEAGEYTVGDDDYSLWFDTAEDMEALRTEARQLAEAADE